MLELREVHKSFRQGAQRIEALRGVSLTLPGPGYFAIMGPSGSGKSTLLHLLAGLDHPDRGEVRIDGVDLAKLGSGTRTTFRRRHIGVVFQQFNLISTLTARQNVALPGVVDRRPRKWLDQRVDHLLERLGVAHRAEHRPEAMSGGEQQRVAIARALLFEPKLILADEPTGSLDTASSTRLWSVLDQVAAEHQATVLVVTHEPAAAAHCQHVYVLADGRLRDDFAVEGNDAAFVASRYQQPRA